MQLLNDHDTNTNLSNLRGLLHNFCHNKPQNSDHNTYNSTDQTAPTNSTTTPTVSLLTQSPLPDSYIEQQ